MSFLEPRAFVESGEAMGRKWSLDESFEYTRWLATHHYENFHVVSFLLPKRLHQDFYNVYSFCRWADDLGDEFGDPERSLNLLHWWRGLTAQAFDGSAEHPVFLALQPTIARHQLPAAPFHDLITAFEQDQVKTRYADWREVFGYCGNSANPVGRLVLYLCGYRDEERQKLSDATCTALQLANFWQDVSVDWKKDRVYLPQDLLARHGAADSDIAAGRATEGFRAAMREACAEAESLFGKGRPLIRMVDRRLSLDLELFTRGGLKILDKIRERNYDVLSSRPRISRSERATLLFRGLVRWAIQRAA
jgi:squalene synthase HpnC